MSDSSMNCQAGLIVGTAGHIDHGKTTLVGALTGIDTDRLAEEKRRGISIDLGFAHLALPDGCRISFVDVPGHERFVKNMLAGAAGIQAVLLVVAADESVKPQTREHFDICRLLGVSTGIIALTKADLASPEQIREACEAIRKLCAGSFLERAPVVTVSGSTGQGLDKLKRELALLPRKVSPRPNSGLARLPIDRSFSLKGFGTVVTGTLWNGVLRTGETVAIHPFDREVRIRGLQVHGVQVTAAVAGQRTAVNLANVDSTELHRGMVLTHRGGLETTILFDASIEWLRNHEIPNTREDFLFHAGTAETSAKLKILSSETDNTVYARLWLSAPVLLLPGDRFVLRRPSPIGTVAGGRVIDAFPPRRINRAKTLLRLRALSKADTGTRVQILVEEGANGRSMSELVRASGLGKEQLQQLIARNPNLVFRETAQRVVSKGWLQRRRQKLLDWLRAFHANNPSLPGAPISASRLGLESQLASIVFEGFSAIRIHSDIVCLTDHQAQFSTEQTEALRNIETAFRQAGLQPPSASEVLRQASRDPKTGRALLETLIKSKNLVRVTDDLIFHADVILHVRKSLSAHKGRRFSVPEFKEWTRISRKYAIPLLEYLDREHVTRREHDSRVVL